MSWRYVHTGSRSPAENMAIDEAMLIAHYEGRTPPTVRFYGWNPPTLSIGYFQRAEREVDLKALHQRGIGFVRRATGGRAVLHDRELTYSLIVSQSHPGIPASVTEAYRVLSAGLLHGFRNLGLEAEMTGLGNSDGESKACAGAVSSACFDSPSRYELVVQGKKIAGSAQMRSKGVILQHGSVLLDLDIGLLFELLRFPDDQSKDRMMNQFEDKAIAVNACLKVNNRPPVDIPVVEEAFRAGFAKGLGAALLPGTLSDYEEALAARLVRQKYGTNGWNLRR
ncbi:lipoate--protein ligase family protein [Paenibacillus alkaliterrae]|uniref:lipoate--protein ligase family protein n=1 Tax=Paenibacillus alkaliterrae TaxID=320909 RepID=UPI001F3A3B69|nr:biotin/lipoate A/B protein ligase family protein [Paenibacillus alkaliterrae]MCF2940465.1 lipoate--protein ligase family protein [Paenibacillus alkaliterrae]